MDAAPRTGWRCGACGRRIPGHVETCRCGADRADAEVAGEPAAVTPAAVAPPRAAWAAHWQTVTAGSAAEAALPAAWRILLRSALVAAAGAVLVATATIGSSDPLPAAGNIRVLARLDEHTRRADDPANTIPSFLALPGSLGVLAPASPDGEPVRGASDAVLRRGFCSPSVAQLVRFDYPTHYRGWSDARLERAVLEKHPEYHDRLCALPYELDADPDDVIKYELQPRSALGWIALSLATLGATAASAIVLLMLYLRLIVPALPTGSANAPPAQA